MIPFRPSNVPETPDSSWLSREFAALKQAMEAAWDFIEQRYLHSTPSRLRGGMIALADGSDWNPGFGAGAYLRNEANDAWKSLSHPTLDSSTTQLKFKKLTGTTGAAQGNTVTVAHGLTGAKILGLQVAVASSANAGIPPNVAALVGGATGYEYSAWWDSAQVNLYNSAANSSNVLSKPFTALITYEA